MNYTDCESRTKVKLGQIRDELNKSLATDVSSRLLFVSYISDQNTVLHTISFPQMFIKIFLYYNYLEHGTDIILNVIILIIVKRT